MKYKVGDWVVWHEASIKESIQIIGIQTRRGKNCYVYKYLDEWYDTDTICDFYREAIYLEQVVRPLTNEEKLELL